MNRYHVVLLLWGALLWGGFSQSAFSKAPSLAEALARLRGEVEALANKIEEAKDAQRAQLRSLSMQRAAMALRLQKERLRLRALQKRLNKQRARISKVSRKGERLGPVVKKAATYLREKIRESLPFRRKERLAVISEIEKQLSLKLITPRRALAKLWQAAEDELRLGREHGLYNQTIELGGQKRLVQVARIGMVMLFFKTRDGKVGAARRRGERWVFELLKSPEASQQISTLMDGLKKQIRAGFWTIPNVLRASR